MDMRKLVGKNFRRVRMERSMTQEQLAESLGFSQQHVSDLERGRAQSYRRTLFDLAKALDTATVVLISVDVT